MHAGRSGRDAKAEGQHRAARLEAHAQAERMLARAGVDADPIEHLLDSLYRAAALVEVWGRMVADLDNAAEVDLKDRPGSLRGERWWESVQAGEDDEGNPKWKLVPRADRLLGVKRDGMVATHPFVDEYQTALDRRAKYAKLCIDAGVAERQVQIAETVGTRVVEVMEQSLAELGVEVTPEVRQVVGRHLRAV